MNLTQRKGEEEESLAASKVSVTHLPQRYGTCDTRLTNGLTQEAAKVRRRVGARR